MSYQSRMKTQQQTSFKPASQQYALAFMNLETKEIVVGGCSSSSPKAALFSLPFEYENEDKVRKLYSAPVVVPVTRVTDPATLLKQELGVHNGYEPLSDMDLLTIERVAAANTEARDATAHAEACQTAYLDASKGWAEADKAAEEAARTATTKVIYPALDLVESTMPDDATEGPTETEDFDIDLLTRYDAFMATRQEAAASTARSLDKIEIDHDAVIQEADDAWAECVKTSLDSPVAAAALTGAN